jgi:hypothetical protein
MEEDRQGSRNTFIQTMQNISGYLTDSIRKRKREYKA